MPVDLQTAVAAAALPATRSLIGSLFKDVRHRGYRGRDALAALARAAGVPAAAVSEVVAAAQEDGQRALERAAARGFAAVPLDDPAYPPLLACIADPPPVLWTWGDPAALGRRIIAVVGSRAASPYALAVGERLAGELAARGLVVASGLARGVDSAAHAGCLRAGGPTVAVLGSGLDRVYPAEHRPLAAEISANGLVLSELPPGTAPLPGYFPLRNRIISGISLAVVVVEADEKSGSLITARCALEQGREVMAVPGSVLSGRNRGSHALLKDGAKVVETADDILDGLGWARPADAAAGSSGKSLEKDPLLALMEPGEAYELETLAALGGTTGPRLLPRLLELELQGRIDAAGGRFLKR